MPLPVVIFLVSTGVDYCSVNNPSSYYDDSILGHET